MRNSFGSPSLVLGKKAKRMHRIATHLALVFTLTYPIGPAFAQSDASAPTSSTASTDVQPTQPAEDVEQSESTGTADPSDTIDSTSGPMLNGDDLAKDLTDRMPEQTDEPNVDAERQQIESLDYERLLRESNETDQNQDANGDSSAGDSTAGEAFLQGQDGSSDSQLPSAEDIKRSLMEDIDAPPVTPPNRNALVVDMPSIAGAPPAEALLDPAVIGTAPGQTPPALRREGEFVINRRGRLVRSPDGEVALFVFDADSKGEGQEPPMILQPSRMLEVMETRVREEGDQAAFIVSGQVFTYRGANYLLPSTVRPAIDRGNLD